MPDFLEPARSSQGKLPPPARSLGNQQTQRLLQGPKAEDDDTISVNEQCKDRVRGDLARARSYVRSALSALEQSPPPQVVQQALRWYFNQRGDTPDPAIGRTFEEIESMIDTLEAEEETFSCETETGSCKDTVAMTGGKESAERGEPVVHLCGQSYFGLSDREKAKVLIHEAGHLVGLSPTSQTDVYRHLVGFRTLPAGQSVRNADSYALFASDVHHKKIPLGVAVSAGLSLGAAVAPQAEEKAGWFASLYVETTFQHPILHVFNPTLRLSAAYLGLPQTRSQGNARASLDRTLSFGLLPGFRIEDPRPERGSFYLSLFGGPTLAIGPRGARAGAEAGIGLGYRWSRVDASVTVTYSHDTSALKGFENRVLIGPVLQIVLGSRGDKR